MELSIVGGDASTSIDLPGTDGDGLWRNASLALVVNASCLIEAVREWWTLRDDARACSILSTEVVLAWLSAPVRLVFPRLSLSTSPFWS